MPAMAGTERRRRPVVPPFLFCLGLARHMPLAWSPDLQFFIWRTKPKAVKQKR